MSAIDDSCFSSILSLYGVFYSGPQYNYYSGTYVSGSARQIYAAAGMCDALKNAPMTSSQQKQFWSAYSYFLKKYPSYFDDYPATFISQKDTVVVVSDSTGLDGFNPNGDTTFQTDSLAWWIAAASNGSLDITSSISVGGYTTADIDKYWNDRIKVTKQKFVVLLVGLNDIYGASDSTVDDVEYKLRQWYEQKIAEIQSWGGVPCIATQFPVGSSYAFYSVAKRKAQNTHNDWRRMVARKYNIPFLDIDYYCRDESSNSGAPYAAYFQGAGSPHPGKEILRGLGFKFWNDSLKYHVAQDENFDGATSLGTDIFWNSALAAGTGGNLNGGAGALPQDVWGWSTGGTPVDTSTTYSIEASTDSKLGSFGGAPVKSNWTRVTTNTSSIPVATGLSPESTAQPGLLFFTSTGVNTNAGDVISATMELDVITPASIIGFSVTLRTGDGTYSYIMPNCGSAFTPLVLADNTKNQIYSPFTCKIPTVRMDVPEITNGGVWCMINPHYSGKSAPSGNAVWRVRNPRIKIEAR